MTIATIEINVYAFFRAHFSHSLCTITHRQKARDWRIRESDHRTLCELICLHQTRLFFYLFIFFCVCARASFFSYKFVHFVVAGCSRCNMYKSRCAALYYILLLIPRFFFLHIPSLLCKANFILPSPHFFYTFVIFYLFQFFAHILFA